MPTPTNPQTPEQILAMLRNAKGIIDSAPASEGNDWRDGRYRVRIEACTVEMIEKGSLAGNLRFKWMLRGVDEPVKNRVNFQDIPVLDDKAAGRVKGRFKVLGLPYGTTEELADSASKCVGMLIEMKLRSGKGKDGTERQYCDFVRAIGDEQDAAHVAAIVQQMGQPGQTTAAAQAQAEIDALAAAMKRS